MTKQEIFDKVATSLIKQGHPCLDGDSCSYYYNGSRCGIGWLVSEAQAKELEENYKGKAITAIKIESLSAEDYFGVDLYFLGDLQEAHDELNDVKHWFVDWLSRMKDIAGKYNLDTSVLGKARV